MLNRRMPNGTYGGVRGERKSPLLDCPFYGKEVQPMAASRIKGITVEIGGDTTKLQTESNNTF